MLAAVAAVAAVAAAATAATAAAVASMVKVSRQVGFLWYAIRCLYIYHNR